MSPLMAPRPAWSTYRGTGDDSCGFLDSGSGHGQTHRRVGSSDERRRVRCALSLLWGMPKTVPGWVDMIGTAMRSSRLTVRTAA